VTAGPAFADLAPAQPAVSEPAAAVVPAPTEPEAAEPVPIAPARSNETRADRDLDPGPEFGGIAGSGPAAGADPDPDLADADAQVDADAARLLRVALGIAWAIAGAATVLGAGLVWSIVSVDDPFGMPSGQSEIVLRSLAQFAAPALLSTGLLGIVALTVVDGLLRARRVGAQRPEGMGEAP
jgi:hypothetical protein